LSTRAGVAAVGGALAYVGAVYVGLPLYLAARCRLRPKPLNTAGPGPATVTVIIAAHDEARSIGEKLDDLAAQRLATGVEVIVASDGSTDGTAEVAARHPSGPTVLDLPRTGKAGALNAAIACATGEVIVFTDANSRLPPDTLAKLLAPFADPEVGGVAGDQRYLDRVSGTARSERDYWSYERLLKRLESCVGSVVSSTGALHAVRRELVDGVPSNVPDDFHLSTGVRVRGARLVFVEDAVAWEEPNDAPATEYRRRVRIITRGLNGLRVRRELFDPRRFGSEAVVFAIHKLARRFVFVAMFSALVGGFALRRSGRLGALVWLCQLGFYTLAAVGTIDPRGLGRRRAVALPAHFANANLAAAHAAWNVGRGHSFVSWTPERG
jgi:cellulose synthase/poly-beta-1,6-N-acetylglucosamine synthase-like glycosyltransferase